MIKDVKITNTRILADDYYTLKKITYQFTKPDGTTATLNREAYDRGDGAVILLYNKQKQTVVLTRQFRMPTYLNGNANGMMIEACAGMLDNDSPEDGIKRETEEETGYKISDVKKVFEAYMSPGAVTEKLYFFVAEYFPDMKISEGGGLEEEEENIDVLEFGINEAMSMIKSGEINDAKTIMLLQYLKLEGIL